MIEMVSIVFKGLADIPDVPMTPTTARSLADLAHSPRLQVSPDSLQGPILNPFSHSAGETRKDNERKQKERRNEKKRQNKKRKGKEGQER